MLRWLCSLSWVSIEAVCPIPPEQDSEAAEEMMQVISENHLSVYSMEQVKEMRFDIGLSVNYHKIISADILKTCYKGFYNVHHSYNLRLRGRNITTHAILNSRKDNIYYHGTTLHKMVPELDAGPIVASVACEIGKDDTAYTLFKKADSLALQLVMEWFPRIVTQTVYGYQPPSEDVHYYKSKDLPSKKIPVETLTSEEVYDYVRAFDFPGNEPAYIIDNGVKPLVIKSREDYTQKIFVAGKYYYTRHSDDSNY